MPVEKPSRRCHSPSMTKYHIPPAPRLGNGNQDEESSQSQTTGDVSEPLVKRRAVGRSRRGTSNEAESRDQEQVMLHSGLVWVLFKVWLQFYKSKFSEGEREGLSGRPRRE